MAFFRACVILPHRPTIEGLVANVPTSAYFIQARLPADNALLAAEARLDQVGALGAFLTSISMTNLFAIVVATFQSSIALPPTRKCGFCVGYAFHILLIGCGTVARLSDLDLTGLTISRVANLVTLVDLAVERAFTFALA